MVDQLNTLFNQIYNDTYLKVIRYITLKCSNTSDVADIVQEVFLEVYSVISKKGYDYIKNSEAFVMHIAKAKVYKHYNFAQRFLNVLPILYKIDENDEIDISDFEFNLTIDNLEDEIVNKRTIEEVWNIITAKSNEVQRVFYLYFYCDMSLIEIAKELKISESNVKHKLYRTLKEIRSIYLDGGEIYE